MAYIFTFPPLVETLDTGGPAQIARRHAINWRKDAFSGVSPLIVVQNTVLIYFKGAHDGNGDEGIASCVLFALAIQLRGSGYGIILGGGGGGDGVGSGADRPTDSAERAAA